MTHKTESNVQPAVARYFIDEYGGENVELQQYQPGPRWYCDIVVQLDWATLFIEVENDADSVRSGIAQALGYAAADPVGGIPMVVTPAGHLNSERIDRLRRSSAAIVREFDTDREEFVR